MKQQLRMYVCNKQKQTTDKAKAKSIQKTSIMSILVWVRVRSEKNYSTNKRCAATMDAHTHTHNTHK